MEGEDYNELNIQEKIPFHKRTSLNYTHDVNIDSQISLISTWRKSKIKFNKNLLKNILSLGILHIISLFYPKLYLKLYCKPCPPKESDYFYIEDINGNSVLSKSIYKRPKIINSPLVNNANYSRRVCFEYKTMKYEYDEKENIILPIYFNISLITNNELVYKYSEGLCVEDEIDCLKDKYGKNETVLNKNIIYTYFIRQNLTQLITTTLSSLAFDAANHVALGIFIFCLSLSMVLIRIIYKYKSFKQLYCDDNSLDGHKHMRKYKVIRRNILQAQIQSKYNYIYSKDILPGDVLLLKEDDFIPCDGVILEGECILSTDFLLGNTDYILRSSLDNNNNNFNYVKNRKNIVLHGMKIIKIYTKNNSKEITVLAINTGSNSFKANLFSNLILKKSTKDFKNIIKKFINSLNVIFSFILFITGICILLILRHLEKKKNSLEKYFLLILGLVFLPINFIVENLIKLISTIHLNNYKIQCTNESILTQSGKIDTVIFSKAGNKPEYKIVAFCPLYFEPGNKKISIREYGQSEEENINKILDSHMKYYRKIAINIDNNDGNDYLKNVNNEAKNEELNALFLQCLVCCTSLEKINNEICGEILDKEILKKMDWDINSIEMRNYDESLYDNKEQAEILMNIIEEIKKKGNIFINNYDHNINYNSNNTISEIFPKDYYKVTEEKNINYKEKISKTIFNKKISSKSLSKETKIFKLIIIHKFSSLSCWNKSCITYNLLDNKCYFMTKGPPDHILKHCTPKSAPDIDKLLSRLIKEGYKIIAFATKLLQLYQIDKNKSEDFYMKDLSFAGFIVIETGFRKEITHIIERIEKMKSSNSISSVISTNDNIYNAIEGCLKNGIINKNNVYVFDIGKNENEGRIIYAKYIYDKDDSQKEQKLKRRNAECNKALLKSLIAGNKNTFHNNNINNSIQKDKNVNSNDVMSSLRTPDSSRRMINSDSNNDELLNNFNLNSNIIEEKKNNTNEDNNIFQTNYPLRTNNNSKNLSKFINTNKNNTTSISNNLNIKNDFGHTNSFYTPSKNLNLSNTEEFMNIPSFTKDSKGEVVIEDDSYLKYKKRRQTTKANLNFNFKNNISYNYECLFFKKYDNQIQPFKHDCILCFSGKLVEYIFNLKEKIIDKEKISKDKKGTGENNLEKYKLDILMTLLKDRVKIFYSMTYEQKSILVKLYRKYLDRSVCMVGNSSSDIEAIVISNIGIMVGSPNNFNTLFCHYYLCDKSLIQIEKILKNGRSFYENISHLFSVNLVYTLLFVMLIIFTYELNTYIDSKKHIFLNCSVFLLCLSAFSIEPDYSIDINSFVMNNKLYLTFNIIKNLLTIILKIIGNVAFWIYFKNNEDNTEEMNNEILSTYYFIFTLAHITSITFSFNTQSYFRKHILNNIIFIFVSSLVFEFLIINLVLSDVAIENYSVFLFINFKTSNTDNADAFEDNHKKIILYIFMMDLVVTYLTVKILRIMFEKYSNKINKKNKVIINKKKD